MLRRNRTECEPDDDPGVCRAFVNAPVPQLRGNGSLWLRAEVNAASAERSRAAVRRAALRAALKPQPSSRGRGASHPGDEVLPLRSPRVLRQELIDFCEELTGAERLRNIVIAASLAGLF